jgi:hypothetical protein
VAVLIERRLRMVSKRISQLRAEVAIADEQLEHFTDESEDARIRALVSETPLAQSECRDAERHSSAMSRHRDDLVARIARLEAEQDELLDRLADRRRR